MDPSPDPDDGQAERIARDLKSRPDPAVASLRAVRRYWSAALRNQPPETVLTVALELFERFDQRWPAYELVLFHPSAQGLLDASLVERFAGTFHSWGDVDQFAVLLAGPAWRADRIETPLVHGWARQSERWWRRAALVATVPLNVRSQGGGGDSPRTLGVCDLLAADADPMVSKALSWALRELVVHDRGAVEDFLSAHERGLASHVKREVRNKLITRLKTRRATRRLA
jgi:3-methyladenine DNA glycosylase AlkD